MQQIRAHVRRLSGAKRVSGGGARRASAAERRAASELEDMARAHEALVAERDAVSVQLQAEPEGDDMEAALDIAMGLVKKHDELNEQIAKIDEDMQRSLRSEHL